ncbi:MAG TPA: phospholipid carrier-dependent glycosyltransferase [Pirellulales bacterium]|nr:phospholipid carrier-dependent glycosyltransferase [Pirellulales bacterium]
MRDALSFRQKLSLAVIVTVGAVLRFESLWQTSLAHFDEGVLASGAFGVWLHGPYYFQLAQPLQSPPLFPWLVAAAHELTQTDWVIMGKMVSAALATATIPAAFLLGRRLQGPGWGLAAAAILAASDLHIAFARMALTDAPLTFWFTWALYGCVRLVDAAVSDDDRRASPPHAIARLIGWTLFTGLAVGAAWNTKYNGWMPLAIAFTALSLAMLRDRLSPGLPRALPLPAGAWRRLLAAGAAATLLAGLCYWPWYRFVDRSFAGGYQAVMENHRAYFGGPAAWPGRAWRLWVSLTAFRHYGWLLALAAGALLLLYVIARFASKRGRARVGARGVFGAATALAGLAVVVPLGGDVALMLLAVAAMVPALAFGRWEQILLAVWMGAFVVLVPFYHPYARLLLPVLPAAIYLSLWLCDSGWRLSAIAPARDGRLATSIADAPGRLARAMAAAAAVAGLALACLAHPFGLVPSRALWQRWSTRDSYRDLGRLVDEHTPADAIVLCQGLPPMPLYCPRRWLSLDQKPFTEFLPRVPVNRPCYLAVDEWGVYGAGHQDTLHVLRSERGCLETVAWTRNDLNLVTLLDNLSPWAAARKLESKTPADRLDDRVRQPDFLPSALQEMADDVIVLYRVDRDCLGEQPSR